MAKPRKQKNEEQKADNSEAVVKHQKLCLSIDLEKRRIYGYTELEVVVPENGIVGLHADNLMIESVMVDGGPARFEIFPHYQQMDSDDRWCSVSSANSAADAAGSVYVSCLERELVPNLLIMCSSEVVKPVPKQPEQTGQENGTQISSESKQNVKLIHIDFWVEKIETGIHIEKDVMHTNNQIRRARCWFPCMDDSSQRCCFDLEFTVANNLVAASTGTLMYQVLSNDDPPRKTYVYRISVPVAAQWISLAVAPFEIFPDRHNNLITHICLLANSSKLQNTVGFLHSAYSHYEHYLSTKFPFGSYTQVFIDPEMAVSSLSLGASMSIFSSQILFDEKIIDQTIDTRIKLAYGLARQWFGVYITAEAANDEWLLDGLAWFLTDSFIKQFLGNNEARYRRYKANCAVCKADDSAATALSSSDASKALYGTQCIGFYGKIRSWKSVAVLQMLEKQMGPESFCKVLKNLVAPPKDTTRPHRTLSTKEFRHLANEVGNLERPFLREFFPRWVGSSGCPVLKMGFSYNKRKNLVELAALRGCTATPDSNSSVSNTKPDFVKREADVGWPGMMSIRVHELDGMYDHPVLPMAGETWQLLEIQCHSKLAAKRFQKPKKGSKHDGSDDNVDTVASVDMRSNIDSPLQWLRADPEMEYLAEIHFNQPVPMWINQLEKDKDVVAQAQAITALELFPRLLSIVNALSNLLCDSQAFWRVRIEAAFALASTASEETDWAGLLHLIKFYKSRRYDEKIGLPKPNDFHDFAEYFVLEAIPHAVALVRAADKKSPREAVEFILQLLKYNENNGNPYSDVYWLAALVQSVGELEFGQQSVPFLSSLVKRIDRLLQFDRLIPSYNGILTVSCIRALTQIALKLSEFIPLDRIIDLIKPFCSSKTQWQVRIEAFRALLDLEYHCKGIDAALILFVRYLEEEPSLRGQVKLGVHAMRLCQVSGGSDDDHGVVRETLVALLRLLESPAAFNNVTLRHYLFCILQVLAGRLQLLYFRPPTLCGVPRDETLIKGHTEICNELKNFFAAIVNQSKPMDPSSDTLMLPYDGSVPETTIEPNIVSTVDNERSQPEDFVVPDAPKDASKEENYNSREEKQPDIITIPSENLVILDSSEAPKEPDTVSNSQERKKPMLKIKMKQSSASSRAEEAENAPLERSQGAHNGADHGTSSSMSMEAPPQRNFNEPANVSNQNLDDVNSCHDLGSRVTASIGSAKLAGDGDSLLKELQCTADSSKVQANDVDPVNHNKFISLRALNGADDGSLAGPIQKPVLGSKDKKDKKKKDKEKKRKKRDEHKSHKDDPEYLERKRLKKEKKRKEKELAKLMVAPATDVKHKEKTEAIKEEAAVVAQLTNMATSVEEAVKRTEPVANRTEGTTSTHKLKIKIKNRTLTRP
ncbi:transcription initiation factor TFIID subunit 2 isoform X3 [Cynara cardunculus var. scolymus]|uniref:transcription initiation factor TFIID subunit 2 isoform X3 n=1 Tax=Cynara cardunculus var. scolymus TaxID=59895 RepID=UPI000D62D512|nr:transcription initiation factor TFIID subunit 2 isoform X3 [Cynara cardunculus var. scolymus]